VLWRGARPWNGCEPTSASGWRSVSLGHEVNDLVRAIGRPPPVSLMTCSMVPTLRNGRELRHAFHFIIMVFINYSDDSAKHTEFAHHLLGVWTKDLLGAQIDHYIGNRPQRGALAAC
jgi:hypothetical protein